MCIAPGEDDIIRYPLSKLDKDTAQDSVSRSLRADIQKKTPGNISGMCVEATAP